MHTNKIILAGVLVAVLAITAIAQISPIEPTPVSIDKLHLVGEGLIIDPENLRDFSFFRIGIATVNARVDNETVKVIRGVMNIEGKIYRLTVTNVSTGSFTADIYYNKTLVGSMTAESVAKGDKIAWVADVTLNGTPLTAYILEFPRLFKPLEIKEKVKEYCEKEPAKCVGIGPNYCDKIDDHDCRVKIVRWCENHTDDTRCKALAIQIGKVLPATPEASTLQSTFQQKVQSKFCKDNPEACAQTIVERILKRGR
jgi:hypothetical protein